MGGLVRAFGQDFRFGVRVGERKNEMLSKFKGEERSRAEQTPLALKASKIKDNNAISHLTDDNNILYPLLPSDTLDQ